MLMHRWEMSVDIVRPNGSLPCSFSLIAPEFGCHTHARYASLSSKGKVSLSEGNDGVTGVNGRLIFGPGTNKEEEETVRTVRVRKRKGSVTKDRHQTRSEVKERGL